MDRELQIGTYKIQTEKSKHGAYKCTVFHDGKLASEYYGPTEYIAIIRALRVLLDGNDDRIAMLIYLLKIGYTDGYEAGNEGWGLEDGINEIDELLNDTSTE